MARPSASALTARSSPRPNCSTRRTSSWTRSSNSRNVWACGSGSASPPSSSPGTSRHSPRSSSASAMHSSASPAAARVLLRRCAWAIATSTRRCSTTTRPSTPRSDCGRARIGWTGRTSPGHTRSTWGSSRFRRRARSRPRPDRPSRRSRRGAVGPGERTPDLARLARLCVYSNGVTRRR
jgi:hypothetical protein